MKRGNVKTNSGYRTKKESALVAHDHKKADLLEWVKFNKDALLQHELFATGTTGKILEKELGRKITTFESGSTAPLKVCTMSWVEVGYRSVVKDP